MNFHIQHPAEQDLPGFLNQPAVVLAISDVDLRETLRGYLCTDYEVHIAVDAKSVFTVSTSPIGCVVFDRAAGFLPAALHDHEQTATAAPSVQILEPGEDIEGQMTAPGGAVAVYLRQPILRGQLLATVKSMATVFLFCRNAEAQRAEQYRMLDGFNESFIAVDADWQITYMNAEAERTMGVIRDLAIGRSAREVLPESVFGGRGATYMHAMEEERSIKTGSDDPERGRFDVVPLDAGGFAIYFSDLKWGNEAHGTTSPRRMQFYLEYAKDFAFVTLNADGEILEWLGGAEAITGWRAAEIIGQSLDVLLTEEDREGGHFRSQLMVVSQQGRIEDSLRMVRKDGSVFPVCYSVNPMVGADGETTGAVLAFHKATESKRAEAMLREGERKLRFIMDSMSQKVFSATSTGDVDYLNQAWACSTGLPFDQMRGSGWTRFIHQDDAERAICTWRNSIRFSQTFHCECRYYDADGGYRWHLFQARPLRDESGLVTMWVGSATDIEQIKAAEEKLAEALAVEKRGVALLADLAAASRALHSELSLDGVVSVLTEKTRVILGADQVEVLLSDDEKQLAAASAVERSSIKGGGFSGDYNPDQIDFDVDGRHLDELAGSLDNGLLTPLIGPAGKHLGLLRVAKNSGDFSGEDQAILAQLARIAAVSIENACLYESLREQDQRKDEFLATLAHELRNPLAPLRTGLDLLKLWGVGDQIERVRDMMSRQLAQVVRLVDDLMDVSRVSRGKIELKCERVPIRVLFDTAIEEVRPLIAASKHQLSVSVPEESLEVYGDPMRLAQVISNLLNNAAKYTSQGGEIQLAAERESDQAVIRVSDTGSGIPRDMLSKVFGLFTQVSPSMDRSRGGVGIGLALVKKLVELHGGSVSAQSPGLGEGSTFCIRLPLLQRGCPSVESTVVPAGAPERKHMRILVVDDNIEAAETLKMLLEYLGQKVVIAHTGHEALREARKFLPDIVFLDIGLPGMSGYDVAAILRREFPDHNMVLIALTGWGGTEGRRRAQEAGFDHHLTKPIDGKGLTEVLEQFSHTGDGSASGQSLH